MEGCHPGCSSAPRDRFEQVWKLLCEVARIRVTRAGYTQHLDVMPPLGKRVDHRVRLPDDGIFLAHDHRYPQAAAGGFETLRACQERSHHDDAGRLEEVTSERRLDGG